MGLFFLLLIFDAIGGLMAFLITYDEMSHHSTTRRARLREAGARALVAFIFLAAFSAIVILILQRAAA